MTFEQTTSIPVFSYIIPYKHRMDRFNNLKKVVEWISRFSNVEIIIVEQDKSPKINTFPWRGVKYYFLENKGAFNKSWAMNYGLKMSTTNIVVFGDCDLIMDPNEFIKSINMINQFDMISPYDKVIDLEQNEVNLPLDEVIKIDRNYRGQFDIQKVPLCGGITIFRKDSIYNIGGWDQNFSGWGAEDDAMTVKVKTLLNWYENTSKCFHLWHVKEQPDMKLYQRNLQLLQKITDMSKDDIRKYSNMSMNKIGMKNLYTI